MNKNIFSKVSEERKIQEAAVTFNVKLKDALHKEKHAKTIFEDSSKAFEVIITNDYYY